MLKEKKRKIDESKQKETTFYHEIIGITAIVIAIIILGKLGKMGEWLTIFFKILFGDCYWFFIVFIFIFGLYNLLLHKAFDFKNQRFIGYIFIALGILIFAHFRLHSVIKHYEGNYFKTTWSIYMTYVSTQNDIYLGGGLLGAIIFYVFYYLFSVVGVVLVATISMLMGISLLFNKTIVEMYGVIASRFKGVKNVSRNFSRFFKYEMGSDKDKSSAVASIFTKNTKVPIKLLEEYKNLMNLSFQEKVSYDLKSLIHSVFNNLNIEFRDLKLAVGYSFTVFEFVFFTEIDIHIVRERLQKVIDEDLICYLENVNNVIIEVKNKHFQVLALRNLLMMQESLFNNYIIPLGLDVDKQVEELDINKHNHLLLIGSVGGGIKNFIKSFVVSLFIKQNLINYEITILDKQDEFTDFKPLLEIIDNDYDVYFDKLTEEIDERMEVISKNNVNTLEEYNKKVIINDLEAKEYRRKFVIINAYNEDSTNYTFFENKLMYITQLGVKCGINIIYIIRNEELLSSVILSIFENKLIFKTASKTFSVSSLNMDYAYYLNGIGDCYFTSKAEYTRIQTPIVSKADFEKVRDYLLK